MIYRPPPSKRNKVKTSVFFEEFASYLSAISTSAGIPIVTGDFNFHVDDDSDSNASTFINLTESFNLTQHVKDATHQIGHTLDLILTQSF